jgi:hypothetical protein
MSPKKPTHFFLFFSVFFFSLKVCQAQKEIPDFGDFTPDEISLKQCDFDKDADAVVLLDKAKSYYNDNYNLITERRIRLKIFKERGVERGNIRIRYYSDDHYETISGIDATVLNPDKQQNQVRNKLDQKSVYNKKLNKYYSEISFALPNVKVGSIIEYKYESEMKNYGGLRHWIFQSEIPVMLSSYHLTIVPNAEFAYSVHKSEDLPIVVKPNAQSGSVVFEMSNIPGLREEAYMGAARDYLQRVDFQFSGYKRVSGDGYGTTSSTTVKYATTWKDLAGELLSNSAFGSQINKKLPGADIMQQVWAQQPDQYLRMKAIHDYVKTHFSWNHIYSKYAEDGLKETWEKKTGTCGEINLILINLLKNADLPVVPLFVSERDNGKVDTSYPYMDQFDKVVAYVTIGENRYILDGTDHETPSFIVPFALLNTTGFIVDKKKASLVKITDDSKKNLNLVSVVGNIDHEGSMTIEAAVKNYDYSKIDKKENYTSDSKNYKKAFFAPYRLNSIDSFSVSGAEADSLPMEHGIKMSCSLNKTGDYYLLNYNLFTGLNKNPFITERRFSDINFGCKYSYNINGTFNLPENLLPETLPKSIRLVTPDKTMTITRQVQQIDSIIQVGVKIDIYKTEFKADEYPVVQGFYKQMIDLLNEPIVLKVKS